MLPYNKAIKRDKVLRTSPLILALEGHQVLTEYQLSAIDQVWYVIPYLLFVSGLYWVASKSVLQSSHGFAILIGFGYAVWVCEYTEFGPPSSYYIPLHIFLFIGLVSLAFSFKAFSGRKWVHSIHAVTLVSAFLVWFVGSMAISHDWI